MTPSYGRPNVRDRPCTDRCASDSRLGPREDPALARLGGDRCPDPRHRDRGDAARRERPGVPPPRRRHHVRHARRPSDGRLLGRGVRQALAQPAVVGSARPCDGLPARRVVRSGRAPRAPGRPRPVVRVPRLSRHWCGHQTRGMAHAGQRRHPAGGVHASTATPRDELLRGDGLAGGTSPSASPRGVDRDPDHHLVGQPARELLPRPTAARTRVGRGPLGTRTRSAHLALGRPRQPPRDDRDPVRLPGVVLRRRSGDEPGHPEERSRSGSPPASRCTRGPRSSCRSWWWRRC